MERECFENEGIARLMNDRFVCIKVDREERPDLDSIYMKAVQAMTGRGGWPMTVFLTPGCRPFYSGTYFPPEDRGGMPGFPRVLNSVADAYRDKREAVGKSAARVVEFLHNQAASSAYAPAIGCEQLAEAARNLVGSMDGKHGGFGQAPKFPGSMALAFLLAMETDAPDPGREQLLRTALDRMAAGGIYDHLGGGFHRYSVDRFWLVPHFEKMLYDQALLAPLFGQAWQAFGEPHYRSTALGVLEFVARELTSPEGGFYATQDADSEGVEGKFFVWSPAEIREVVGEADADLVCRYFDVSEVGNFEGENILHPVLTPQTAASMFGRTTEQVTVAIERARGLLFERRAGRVAPGRDEKIVSDWNGLMIAAMAKTGRLLERPDLVAVAARAADFVRERMHVNGVLHHFYADGELRVHGFLDDHAFFALGCLELYYALGRREDYLSAVFAADRLIAEFEDREAGGFRFASSDGERLVAPTRDMNDGALPSGNSVAADVMLSLHHLTGNDEYRRAGEGVLEAFGGQTISNPYGGGYLLSVLRRNLQGLVTIVVTGDDDRARELERVAVELHCPQAAVIAVREDETAEWLPAVLQGKTAGPSCAYVCRGNACGPPVTSAEALTDVVATFTG